MKATVLAIVAAIALSGCGSTPDLVDRRAAEWKNKADAGIPAGRSVEEAKAWGAKNGIDFGYSEKQRQLYATVERVPVTDLIKFCSETNIHLTVNFSAGGQTVSNEVETYATCL